MISHEIHISGRVQGVGFRPFIFNLAEEFQLKGYVSNDELGMYRDWETDRKSTRLNSSHRSLSRMPSSA